MQLQQVRASCCWRPR